MENITRLDIARDGLSHAKPLAFARNAAAEREKDYLLHVARINSDKSYKENWLRNEQDFQESKQKNFYY